MLTTMRPVFPCSFERSNPKAHWSLCRSRASRLAGLGVKAHAALHQFHRGIGNGAHALRTFTQYPCHVSRLRSAFAIPLLKRLEVRAHHGSHLPPQITAAHAVATRRHLLC